MLELSEQLLLLLTYSLHFKLELLDELALLHVLAVGVRGLLLQVFKLFLLGLVFADHSFLLL